MFKEKCGDDDGFYCLPHMNFYYINDAALEQSTKGFLSVLKAIVMEFSSFTLCNLDCDDFGRHINELGRDGDLIKANRRQMRLPLSTELLLVFCARKFVLETTRKQERRFI